MTCDTTRARKAKAQSRRAFGVAVGLLAFATFAIVTSEFIVVSLLPAITRDLGVSLADAGRVVTSFALAAAIGGPPLTIVAARHEPKLIVIATASIIAAGNLVVALAPRYETLILARIAQGCALTVFVSVSAVAAARLAGAAHEGRAISLVNTGVVATIVLGVPAGAMVAEKASWHASFAGLAILSLIAVASIAIWLPRTGTVQPTTDAAAAALWRPGFLSHLLLSGVLFTGMFAAYTFIAALLDAAGFSATTVGWMLAGFGLAGIVGNWIAGYGADYDALAATAGVALTLAAAMVTVGLVTHAPILLMVVMIVWGAAHMAAFVVSQVHVMQAGRAAPALAMSLNIAVCNLGIALGSVFGGWIADSHGVESTGYGGGIAATVAALIAIAMIASRAR